MWKWTILLGQFFCFLTLLHGHNVLTPEAHGLTPCVKELRWKTSPTHEKMCVLCRNNTFCSSNREAYNLLVSDVAEIGIPLSCHSSHVNWFHWLLAHNFSYVTNALRYLPFWRKIFSPAQADCLQMRICLKLYGHCWSIPSTFDVYLFCIHML